MGYASLIGSNSRRLKGDEWDELSRNGLYGLCENLLHCVSEQFIIITYCVCYIKNTRRITTVLEWPKTTTKNRKYERKNKIAHKRILKLTKEQQSMKKYKY